LFSYLNAKITINEINSKPAGFAKNSMIWQYLKQDISPFQADKAYKQVDGKSNKLLYAYVKKTNNKEIKRKISCMRKKDILSIKDKDCLELAFAPYKTLYFTAKQRKKIILNLKSESKKDIVKIQSELCSEESLLNLSGTKFNSQSNFYLALNDLRHSNKESALSHFSLSKAKRIINIDKNNFWIYQLFTFLIY